MCLHIYVDEFIHSKIFIIFDIFFYFNENDYLMIFLLLTDAFIQNGLNEAVHLINFCVPGFEPKTFALQIAIFYLLSYRKVFKIVVCPSLEVC